MASTKREAQAQIFRGVWVCGGGGGELVHACCPYTQGNQSCET